MKLQKELLNGSIIFLGITAYFIIIELLGFSYLHYLRVLNILIVYYGVHRVLSSNVHEGKLGYVYNLRSAGITALIGVALSVIGLIGYIYIRGGNTYLDSLSELFLFGGNPSVIEYCIGILFEGIASAIVVIFIAMQLWVDKVTIKN
jgi:hypothetical protein